MNINTFGYHFGDVLREFNCVGTQLCYLAFRCDLNDESSIIFKAFEIYIILWRLARFNAPSPSGA
jgi:hypothetical protein